MNRLSSVITTFTRNSFMNVTASKEVCCALRISFSQLSTHCNTYRNKNEILNTKLLDNALSGNRHLFGPKTVSITGMKIDGIQPHQSVREYWSKSSLRVGRGPRGNNGKRSPRTIQGAFQCHPHKKRFKKTLSRRFAGHVDVFNRNGEIYLCKGPG